MIPGSQKPDVTTTTRPTHAQQADAAAYIARQSFDDEAELLEMLGLAS